MATGRKKGALTLLQSYGTDSDDEDSGYTSEDEKKRKQEFHNPHESFKKRRKRDEEEDMVVENDTTQPCCHCASQNPSDLGLSDQQTSMATTSSRPRINRIPVPAELCDVRIEHEDDPVEHEGRIRSFAHERGNWASLLYVPLHLGVYGPSFTSFLAALVAACHENDLKLTPSKDLHISLSKTLVLQLHWIQPLVNELRGRLGGHPKFSLWLHGLNVYVNDEKTRTFLGLRVCHGRSELESMVSEADLCIAEYRLPPFYKEGSFHASIAWCTGDVSEDLRRLLPVLENVCSQYFAVESDMRTFDVNMLTFKTGNRLHNIHLKNSI